MCVLFYIVSLITQNKLQKANHIFVAFPTHDSTAKYGMLFELLCTSEWKEEVREIQGENARGHGREWTGVQVW